MSAAINRSITTIKNELEFLQESGVVSKSLAEEINTKLSTCVSRPSPAPPARNTEMVEAIYDFATQEAGDLALRAGDKITVIEKPSNEWWKGTCNGNTGMFPSNYVKPLQQRDTLAPPQYSEKAQEKPQMSPQPSGSNMMYQPPQQYYQPPPQQQYYQQPQQQFFQQPPPQQYVQEAPPQQQPQGESTFKKFGSKLGNAAIFGAGATLGSDLVNSIF